MLTLEYVLLRVVPRPFTTATIASAIPAAISAYSMAVAADSSFKNFNNMRDKSNLLVLADTGFSRFHKWNPRWKKLKLSERRY